MKQATAVVTVEKLVEGSWGLARREEGVVLIRGAIPGESVTLTGEIARKKHSEAQVGEVVAASPDRVPAPCPVYGLCGGCQLQHMRYEAQLACKREVLAETLARVGKVALEEVPPPLASPSPYGYRSTIRFLVFRQGEGFGLGFHREHSHDPVDAACCLLVPETMRDAAAAIASRLGRQSRLPLRARSLEIRQSLSTGDLLLVHATGPADRSRAERFMALFHDLPHVAGQVVAAGEGRRTRRWVTGRDWIEDVLCGLTFRVSDRSFMQANWRLNEVMAQTVAEWAVPSPDLRVLELYAGIGTLGLPLARRGAYVTEVEANPYALKDARHASKVNHIGRCRFRRMEAEAMLATVTPGDYDLILADPPRVGLTEACIDGLVRSRVPRLLYLSCDAPTLARDLSRLGAGGYRISRIQPFDMFAQTSHLETLVELVTS